jgi:hypothetical protein
MTVLPPEPMTPIGLPLKRGFVCCSTEAKNASISAQRIIFSIVTATFGLSCLFSLEEIDSKFLIFFRQYFELDISCSFTTGLIILSLRLVRNPSYLFRIEKRFPPSGNNNKKEIYLFNTLRSCHRVVHYFLCCPPSPVSKCRSFFRRFWLTFPGFAKCVSI